MHVSMAHVMSLRLTKKLHGSKYHPCDQDILILPIQPKTRWPIIADFATFNTKKPAADTHTEISDLWQKEKGYPTTQTK